ncbi:GGDEF domain-containing protein [Kineococcus sp. NBC_00420]|uniref:GGDEF domain-containing protein n=1 Tax=Kineococcus sp. NBC_00420 TaxID=2903564 RepID=UPI002E1BEF89
MQDADYRRLVEDSPLATLLVAPGGDGWLTTWANPAAADLLGRSGAEEATGLALADLVHRDDVTEVLEALEHGVPGEQTAFEWRFVRPDGETVTVEVLLGPADGSGGLSLSCWDVSQHVARTRDLTHRATHDRLTGLPNRGLLEDRWALARSRARRTGHAPVVAFCDVDDLKQLNDVHGHLVGDHALVRIAERLTGASRGEDTVARFGGDEFIVLVESSLDVEPQALTHRLREAVAGVPVSLPDGTVITVSCSVGLVVDDLGESTAEVLARADRHMYEDKRRSR